MRDFCDVGRGASASSRSRRPRQQRTKRFPRPRTLRLQTTAPPPGPRLYPNRSSISHNFIGLAENQWDFTAPGGAPGFGPLLETEQIRRMLARIVGDGEPKKPTPSGPPVAQSDNSETPRSIAFGPTDADAKADVPEKPSAAAPADEQTVRPDTENAAPQNGDDGEQSPAPRRHGGALPQ